MLRKRSHRGQGLAEYALIIALVAIVVVAIGLVLGLAVQRGFGLVVGGLQNNASTDSGKLLIEKAYCAVSSTQTGMWVTGLTTIPLSDLEVETNQSSANKALKASDGTYRIFPPEENGSAGTFKWNPTIHDSQPNLSYCPTTIFIRNKRGSVGASAPITKLDCRKVDCETILEIS